MDSSYLPPSPVNFSPEKSTQYLSKCVKTNQIPRPFAILPHYVHVYLPHFSILRVRVGWDEIRVVCQTLNGSSTTVQLSYRRHVPTVLHLKQGTSMRQNVGNAGSGQGIA
eukprot:1393338-Amorphochlora_amoeboformis.AAC.1